MVQIFVSSGRLVLLPEDKDENTDDDYVGDDDGVEPMDIDEDISESKDINCGDDADHGAGAKVEEDATSTNWSDASSSQADKDDAVQSQFDESPVQMFGNQKGDGAAPSEAPVHADGPERTQQDDSLPTVEENSPPSPAAAAAAEVPSWVYSEQPSPASNMDGSAQSLPNLTRQTRMAAYSSRSVSQLRSIASERGIDVSDCVEKGT